MGFVNDPFFLLGFERSGTTMLRLMLNEHSRLHIPRESEFITELLDKLPADTRLGPGDLDLAFKIIGKTPGWINWGIEKDELFKTITGLQGPSLGELIHEVFLESCRGANKVRWGDKTPYYLEEIEGIHKLFPKAKFVHLTRDVRDICISLRSVGWHGYYFHHLASYWERVIRAGIKEGRKLGSLYMEVAYEDLVRQPEANLKEICDFLEEEYEPRMLDFYQNAEQHIGSWEKDIHTKLFRPPQPSDTGRWQRELNPFQIAIVEAVAGKTMDLVGQKRRYRGVLRLFPLAICTVLLAAQLTRPLRHLIGIKLPIRTVPHQPAQD